MNHYLKLESRANPLDVSDKRALAEAQYSSGLVGLAAGRRDYGLDALAKAYEIWREVGFSVARHGRGDRARRCFG